MMNRGSTVNNGNSASATGSSPLEQRVASGGSAVTTNSNPFPVTMPDCTQFCPRESSLGSYAGDFMALMQSNNSYQQQPPPAAFAKQSNPFTFPIDSFLEAESLAHAGLNVEHALQNKSNLARTETPSTFVDSSDAHPTPCYPSTLRNAADVAEQVTEEVPIDQVGPPPANDDMDTPALSPLYTIVAAAPQNGGGKELRVTDEDDDALSVSSSCTSGSVYRLEDAEEDSDDDEGYEELQGRRRRRRQRTSDTSRNTTSRKRGGALLTKNDQQNKGKKRRCRRVYEPEVKVYVHYRDEDVLCQRGGKSNGHPGNIMYLKSKRELQPQYFAATKAQKTDVSQELVDRVHAWGGRFLKKDYNKSADEEQWYEVHNHAARTKAGQALREVYTPEKGAAKRIRYANK